MVKDGAFTSWITVCKRESPFVTLVNPARIENIYPSEGKTVVCLTSGKKLIDGRSIARFLKEEGRSIAQRDPSAYGEVIQKYEEHYGGKKSRPDTSKMSKELVGYLDEILRGGRGREEAIAKLNEVIEESSVSEGGVSDEVRKCIRDGHNVTALVVEAIFVFKKSEEREQLIAVLDKSLAYEKKYEQYEDKGILMIVDAYSGRLRSMIEEALEKK